MSYLMPLFTNHTPKNKKALGDVMLVAAHVIRDMGAVFTKNGHFWTKYLGDRHGGYTLTDLTGVYAGRDCNGLYRPFTDEIFLDWRLSELQKASTLRHEICHKMLMGADRFLELNYYNFSYHDRVVFNEQIAEMVSWAFQSPEILERLMQMPNHLWHH